HAHIVPIHSVHDDPATGLRLLCMPFFGGANLAQLLEQAWGLEQANATGQSLVNALDLFSQRLSTTAGQRVSQSLAMPTRAHFRSRSRLELPAAAGASDPSTTSSLLGIECRQESVSHLRSFVNRLIDPDKPAGRRDIDPDDGLPSRQFLRGANRIQ